jgi:hypothetical protein
LEFEVLVQCGDAGVADQHALSSFAARTLIETHGTASSLRRAFRNYLRESETSGFERFVEVS